MPRRTNGSKSELNKAFKNSLYPRKEDTRALRKFRTKVLRMPRYKKKLCTTLERIMHLCINRDFRGA